MNSPYVPTFVCEYCGEESAAFVDHQKEQGLFIPCQCKEARKKRDQEHYLQMERRKQLRRKNR